MKGQQKTSFATATSKVFQTDDLYARNISSVSKLHLSDGTDLIKMVLDMKTITDSYTKQIEQLTVKLKELQDKVDSFEVE